MPPRNILIHNFFNRTPSPKVMTPAVVPTLALLAAFGLAPLAANAAGQLPSTVPVCSLPSVGFASASQRVMESDGTVSILARLSSTSPRDVTIPFSVAALAKEPADYSAPPRPLLSPVARNASSSVPAPGSPAPACQWLGAPKGIATVSNIPGATASTATQSVFEGSEPVDHPPVLNYPYAAYPNAPELKLQPSGWPLTPEERDYVLKTEGLRFPGVEANQHLPQFWPVTPMAACWGETGDSRWLDHHTTLVNTVQANRDSIDILLIGDSLTEYWGGGFSGAPWNAAWKSHFSQYKSINIGIGGDRTQSILWRLNHGALDGAAPKVVVLLIGTNNINSTAYNGTPIEAVAQGIKLCVDGVRAKCPNAEIIVVRPFPMGPVGSTTFVNGQKINTAVEGLKFENDPQVHLLDFYRDFFNTDGSIKVECFDGPQSILHLDSVKGYNLYADKLKAVVEQLMAKIAAAKSAPKVTPLKGAVKCSHTATELVTVPSTRGGAAMKDQDYTVSASFPTIPVGVSLAEITVNPIADVTAETRRETVVITLGTPLGGSLGTERVYSLLINDNEPPAAAKAE